MTNWRKVRPRKPATATPPEKVEVSVMSPRSDGGHPDPFLLTLLDAARDLLAAVGVKFEVLTIDEYSAMLVSGPTTDQISVQTACDLSRRALTQVASTLGGPQTKLVELRCGQQSEWPCTFSLEWGNPRPVTLPADAIPSLEMLIAGQDYDRSLQLEARTDVEAESAEAPPPDAEGPPAPGTWLEPVETAPQAEITSRPHPGWLTVRNWLAVPGRFAVPRWVGVPPWLRRRWRLLVLCAVAGLAGGFLARVSQSPMYSASSEIVVATGAGEQGPGDANDAVALALTDASILPSDQALLHTVSHQIGMSTSAVSQHLSASVEAGTSVVIVSFQSSDPRAAIKGANAVARAVTSVNEESSAIPNGSLALVQLATGTSSSGTLRKYGIPLGALLGLMIGFIFILAIERADPRADDVEDLAQATGTAATAYPGPVTLTELAQLIGRASSGAFTATLVPLSDEEVPDATALRDEWLAGSDHQSFAFDVAGPVGSASYPLTRGMGPTVIVVKEEARLREVKESVQRLELLGRRPVWAVLAVEAGPSESQP
jgi:capsular polysaccharide biosynthesis protein